MPMRQVYSHYEGNIRTYTQELGNLKKRIHAIGSIRLLLVAGLLLTLWALRDASWLWLTGITAAFALPFIILMRYHDRLYAKKLYLETLIRHNEEELKGLGYDFSPFDGASDKISADHPFSLDLDLFGERSLFQSINRTVTGFGRERLAGWFSGPLMDKGEILRRQEAIREMAGLPDLRQRFRAVGSIRNERSALTEHDVSFMDKFSRQRYAFSDNRFWKAAIWIVPIGWAVLGIAAFPEGVMADAFGRETALLGNLMMGLALPLLVLAVCWGRGMFRHSPHFVYKSAQKTEDMVAEEQSEKKTEKTEKND